jgi:hypothetical protein
VWRSCSGGDGGQRAGPAAAEAGEASAVGAVTCGGWHTQLAILWLGAIGWQAGLTAVVTRVTYDPVQILRCLTQKQAECPKTAFNPSQPSTAPHSNTVWRLPQPTQRLLNAA